jgi:hypothetical protein
MRQPSRATLFRQRNRRLHGLRASRLGRKRISSVKVGRDNDLIAQALFFLRRGRMRMMPSAEQALESSGLPAALLAIAAWDICRPVQRKRSANKLEVDSMAKKLAARYEGRIAIAAARKLVAAAIANNEGWVAEFKTADRPSGDWEPRTRACPSTELDLSRRMISYWRGHRSYPQACALVRRLWRDAEND